MALSEIDRHLMTSLLRGESQAWRDFVDRFAGLVVHVVEQLVESWASELSSRQRGDIVLEFFRSIRGNDFYLLRQFSEDSSLATYLTVVARRIAGKQIRYFQQNA